MEATGGSKPRVGARPRAGGFCSLGRAGTPTSSRCALGTRRLPRELLHASASHALPAATHGARDVRALPWQGCLSVHTLTCMHTRLHACTHAHMHAHALTCMHTRKQTSQTAPPQLQGSLCLPKTVPGAGRGSSGVGEGLSTGCRLSRLLL